MAKHLSIRVVIVVLILEIFLMGMVGHFNQPASPGPGVPALVCLHMPDPDMPTRLLQIVTTECEGQPIPYSPPSSIQ